MLTAVVLAILGLLFIWFSLWALDNDLRDWIIQAALVLTIILVTGLIIGVLGLYSIVLILLLLTIFFFYKERFRRFF